MSHRLRLADGNYLLDGRTLAPGEEVELRLTGGRWLRGRFVWNGDAESQPVLAIALGGLHEQLVLEPNERVPEAIVRFEVADAELRRPR